MTVWSLGTLLYVLLLGDIPYETTDHIIHNKPKKVLLIPRQEPHPFLENESIRGLDEFSRNHGLAHALETCQ